MNAFQENATRPIQRFERRFVAVTSTPLKFCAYPGWLVRSRPEAPADTRSASGANAWTVYPPADTGATGLYSFGWMIRQLPSVGSAPHAPPMRGRYIRSLLCR